MAKRYPTPAELKSAPASHVTDTTNPHSVTAAQANAAASNDTRLSDNRTPTDASVTDAKVAAAAAIAESKLALASDAIPGTASRRSLGTGAQQAAPGNDTRLSDARTPTTHKTSHATGGADALAASDIDAAPRLSPALNLMPDSGRYGGKQNPMALTTAGAYANLGWLSGFNGTTDAEIGKFIHNNTTNGGTAGALTQSVIDLLAAMGRTSLAARYGTEFRVSKYTMGTGTVDPLTTGAVTRYLATTNGARAMFGPGALNTFAAWVRCTATSVILKRTPLSGLGGVVRSELNGVEQAGGIVLTPADGWKHVLVLSKTLAGYVSEHPFIYAEPGATFEVACPYFAAGEVNLDWRNDHAAPLTTVNELLA